MTPRTLTTQRREDWPRALRIEHAQEWVRYWDERCAGLDREVKIAIEQAKVCRYHRATARRVLSRLKGKAGQP